MERSLIACSRAIDNMACFPPIVEYSLTPLGESILQPMRALNQWTQARSSYDQI